MNHFLEKLGSGVSRLSMRPILVYALAALCGWAGAAAGQSLPATTSVPAHNVPPSPTVTASIIDQVLSGDGALKTTGTFFVVGGPQLDRLRFTLPAEAQKITVFMDGAAADVHMEMGSGSGGQPLQAGLVSCKRPRSILQISYDLANASPARLPSVEFPAGAEDSGRTFWNISLPDAIDVLHEDRRFTRTGEYEIMGMLESLSKDFGRPALDGPEPASFEHVQNFIFSTHGPPGELSLFTADHRTFGVLATIVVVGVGLILLPFSWLAKLAAAVVCVVATFVTLWFFPHFVARFAEAGALAGLGVLILWVGQWVLVLRTRHIDKPR
jgi:uncharacterized membrane protein YphA (DoxX/SURF4 family)